MWKQINLQEAFDADLFAEGRYTWLKAETAAILYPGAYRVECDTFHVNTSKVTLSIEEIKMRLRWGYQWNSWEI